MLSMTQHLTCERAYSGYEIDKVTEDEIGSGMIAMDGWITA
jgi:hypothetical protein